MIYWRDVDTTQLYQPFYEIVDPFLRASPYDWYVTEGYRSPERSAILYAAYKAGTGVRAAPAGLSAHNWGLAIDVALDGDPVKFGLQMTWDVAKPGWLWLKQATLRHPKLSGGWKFSDWPHIEMLNWPAFRQVSKPEYYAEYSSGKSALA